MWIAVDGLQHHNPLRMPMYLNKHYLPLKKRLLSIEYSNNRSADFIFDMICLKEW
jgi:hypothetical protein